MRTPRVLAYDVSDDGARQRVEAAVARYGRRVQYSVFEGAFPRRRSPPCWRRWPAC